MTQAYAWLRTLLSEEASLSSLVTLAKDLELQGDLESAATAYDRAYGSDPDDGDIATLRAGLLDRLARTERGLRLRYIPAGSFTMGSDTGDADEQPVHPVEVDAFWIMETPLSWAAFADLMGWTPPSDSLPVGEVELEAEEGPGGVAFYLREANKIRLQYCEDATTGAGDWHAHVEGGTLREVFGTSPRSDPRRPWQYERKPMVAIGWQDAEELGARLSTAELVWRLPTEAEWELAARGGLVGCQYPWGNEPPAHDRCDFDRFHEFSILPMRRFAPNGYGLYAMSGGVWEWTRDWYDAEFYRSSPARNPTGPPAGREKVLRGGSWSDCAEVATVSFRNSRASESWRQPGWGPHYTPNIGLRLCCVRREPPT
jgi:formylglycine-generating enzyme required for sulfatase activity